VESASEQQRGGPSAGYDGRLVVVAGYGMLLLLGVAQSLVGCFQYSRALGPVPAAALAFDVVIGVTCVLGAWGMRSPLGGLMPAVGWFVSSYVLAMGNYEVVAAANYDDALLLARTNRFDLYLIDNWMSGGSGIDLCKKLREFDTWTPILFYSGAAYERDKQQAFAAGAQGYLVKPVDNDELLEEVSRIISAAKCTHGDDSVERGVLKG